MPSKPRPAATRSRLIVALDTSDRAEALRLVSVLRDHAGFFKVGLQLFGAHGPSLVRQIVEGGAQVFLDLKIHDIPNTAAHAVGEAARMGAALTDLHAAGGAAMLGAAVKEARRAASPGDPSHTRLLGVTMLTSMDAATARSVGFHGEMPDLVVRLARLAQDCGLDGVVTSAHEVAAIRSACGESFLIVVPGIRPEGAPAGDQKRAGTPSEAVRAGADYLVIGRPITAASDPAAAAAAIIAEIGG